MVGPGECSDGTVPEAAVPAERRERNPLMTSAGWRQLRRILAHPHAPRWNFETGDRLQVEDLEAVDAFRTKAVAHVERPASRPSDEILAWVAARRDEVELFRERIPVGFDLARDWDHLPTMSREDLAVSPERFMPGSAELDRLIVYDTSGTTGHALVVPHHPRTVALNHVFAELLLRDWDVPFRFDAEGVACVNVCAQRHTYVFANVFAVWKDAGFAKVNLHPADWARGAEDARAFLADLDPVLITADPVTLAEMMRWEIRLRPGAIVSTALTLSPGLRERAEAFYGCPVVDWYSSTETGPLAYAVPDGKGRRLVAPDCWVEILDEEGSAVADGAWGEIAVTGGRNPYVPLLRYRTGDRGRVELVEGPRGPERRLADIEGRAMCFYRDMAGGLVNPVDVSRIMRLHAAFVQHEFLQRADGSLRCRVRPAPHAPLDLRALEGAIRQLFGDEQPLEIVVDETLGDGRPGGKVLPWRSELDLELP